MEISITWNVCRVCLQEEQDSDGSCGRMRYIFSDERLAKQIYECAGVMMKPDDSLPEKICRKCLTVLKYAVNFRKTCRNSDDYLQSVIQRTKSASTMFKKERKRGDTMEMLNVNMTDMLNVDMAEDLHDEESHRSTDEGFRESREKRKLAVIKSKVSIEATLNESKKAKTTDKTEKETQMPESIKSAENYFVDDSLVAHEEEEEEELEQELRPEELETQNFDDEDADEEEIVFRKHKTSSSRCSFESDDFAEEGNHNEQNPSSVEVPDTHLNYTKLPTNNNKMLMPDKAHINEEQDEETNLEDQSQSEKLYLVLNDFKQNTYETDDHDDVEQGMELIQVEENGECRDELIHQIVTPEAASAKEEEEDLNSSLEFNDNLSTTQETLVVEEYIIEDDKSTTSDVMDKAEKLRVKPSNRKPEKERSTNTRRKAESLYVCYICGNNFTNRQLMNCHMRVHRQEKTHECELCFKRFITACNLQAHMRIHTGEKPYECQYCARRFTDRSTHIKHERVHTNEKPFGCEYCGKTFALSTTLNAHEKIHTGERPYKCNPCAKSFKLAHQLKAHLNTHLHRALTSAIEQKSN